MDGGRSSVQLPKRADYRGRERVSAMARGGCCLRRLLIWTVLLALIVGGYQLYLRREQFRPPVQEAVGEALGQVEAWVATQRAPTATPPPSLLSQARRAEEAWQGGFMEDATEQYALLVDTFPNEASIYQRLARGQLALDRYAAGHTAAQQAITADPYSSQSWALLALALIRDERPAAAISNALQALFLNEEHTEARAYLAEAYAALGQTDRAFALIKQALAQDGENAEAMRVYGQLLAEADFDFLAAQAELERAYDRAPHLPSFALALANNQIRLNEHEDALSTLLELLDRNPSHSGALYWLGFIYNSVFGNPERANEYLTRCVEVAPEDRACRFYLGRMQKDRLGQFGEAALHLERVIELGSEDPRVYYHAADTYRYLSECARALPLIEQGYALAIEQEYDKIYENIFLDFDFLLGECRVASG